MRSGRRVATMSPASAPTKGSRMAEPLLQVRGLTKSFPHAGRGLPRRRCARCPTSSFSLERGETLGLVGESGCGKSTLARLILHLIEPDSGNVVIGGADFTRRRYGRDAAPPQGANRVSGRPVLSQPAHDGRRQHCRADAAARPRLGRRAAGGGARMLELVGLKRGGRGALSARILRRPVPAHRHRPGADPAARHRRVRRGRLGARRLDSRPDPAAHLDLQAAASASPTSSSRTISAW